MQVSVAEKYLYTFVVIYVKHLHLYTFYKICIAWIKFYVKYAKYKLYVHIIK